MLKKESENSIQKISNFSMKSVARFELAESQLERVRNYLTARASQSELDQATANKQVAESAMKPKPT